MATLPSYFTDFLSAIRPRKAEREAMRDGHRTLRQRLVDYEPLQAALVSDFLQGSYRRSTAIKPAQGKRSDVDIIVVTNLNEHDYPEPRDALKLFVPFFERHYEGKYELQGRSFGIELSAVDLDVVFTSAPSEVDLECLVSESVRVIEELENLHTWRLLSGWQPGTISVSGDEWKAQPLRIPDRDAGKWEDTHPLEQIRWTHQKNRNCQGHYVNVVKAIKWWHRRNTSLPRHPKGYPLERLIAYGCPDGVESVAEGVTQALEKIRNDFQDNALVGSTPFVEDHGLPENNVLERVAGTDFQAFHREVSGAAKQARKAFDEDEKAKSAAYWQDLLGPEFPEWNGGSDKSTSNTSGGSSYTVRGGPSDPGRGRFGHSA